VAAIHFLVLINSNRKSDVQGREKLISTCTDCHNLMPWIDMLIQLNWCYSILNILWIWILFFFHSQSLICTLKKWTSLVRVAVLAYVTYVCLTDVAEVIEMRSSETLPGQVEYYVHYTGCKCSVTHNVHNTHTHV